MKSFIHEERVPTNPIQKFSSPMNESSEGGMSRQPPAMFSGTAIQMKTSAAPNTYSVKSGDTLGSIAKANNLSLEELIALNPGIKNPNKIYPGLQVTIKGSTQQTSSVSDSSSYTIQKGDSLNKIASQHGISLSALLEMNPQIKNANLIHPGMKLTINQSVSDETKPEDVAIQTLSGSVGKGGENSKDDAIMVQELLNKAGYPISIDGIVGKNTINAITSFQRKIGIKNTDGRIDVGGRTWNALTNPQNISQEPDQPAPTTGSLAELAKRYNVEPAVLLAIQEVESSGSGFLKDGRPKILFEGHIFWRQLQANGKNPNDYLAGNGDILYPSWTKQHYVGGSGEHSRLDRAKGIDKTAALKSASWGSFQIMGFNHSAAGYGDVESFVNAMHNPDTHLPAVLSFMETNGILQYVQGGNKNWAEFARRYNGNGYKQNQYDTKLIAAYNKHKANGGGSEAEPEIPTGNQLTGSVGQGGKNNKGDVTLVQNLLIAAGANIKADGVMGKFTIDAIQQFQSSGVGWSKADGRVDVGGQTWGALSSGNVKFTYTKPTFDKQQKPEEDLSNTTRPYEKDVESVYGAPGSHSLKSYGLPFDLGIAWGGNASSARLHKKVGDSLVAALSDVKSHYGMEGLKELRIDKDYGGTYNKRPKRGGSSWSMHAYGVAIDMNISENKLRWGASKALFAKKEYKAFLDIMERHGWYNQGRYLGFDYMHFQAVRF